MITFRFFSLSFWYLVFSLKEKKKKSPARVLLVFKKQSKYEVVLIRFKCVHTLTLQHP